MSTTERDRNYIYEVTYNMPVRTRTRIMYLETMVCDVVKALAIAREVLPIEAEIVGIQYESQYDSFIKRLKHQRETYTAIWDFWLGRGEAEAIEGSET